MTTTNNAEILEYDTDLFNTKYTISTSPLDGEYKNPTDESVHNDISAFIIEIIDEESEFFEWKFQVNGLKLTNGSSDIESNSVDSSSHIDCTIVSSSDDGDESPLTMSIDYDILYPSSDVVCDKYGSPEAQQIVEVLGGYVTDFIFYAITNQSFHITEEGVHNDNSNASE